MMTDAELEMIRAELDSQDLDVTKLVCKTAPALVAEVERLRGADASAAALREKLWRMEDAEIAARKRGDNAAAEVVRLRASEARLADLLRRERDDDDLQPAYPVFANGMARWKWGEEVEAALVAVTALPQNPPPTSAAASPADGPALP